MTGDAAPHLLLVEDSAVDAELITYALSHLPGQVSFTRLDAPGAALDWLEGAERLPDLALVDVGLPGGGGVALVRGVRCTWNQGQLPIAMLSSSAHDDDIAASYRAGANAYLVKPLGIAELIEVMDSAVRFWCAHNRRYRDG